MEKPTATELLQQAQALSKKLDAHKEKYGAVYIYIRHNPTRYLFSPDKVPNETPLVMIGNVSTWQLKEGFKDDLRPDGWYNESVELRTYLAAAFKCAGGNITEMYTDLAKPFSDNNITPAA